MGSSEGVLLNSRTDVYGTPASNIAPRQVTQLFAMLAVLLCCLSAAGIYGQSQTSSFGFDPYVTFAGNFDLGYHETQFYQPHHDAAVGDWDTRAELWLPPFRTKFSWGPYLRIAGIGASKNDLPPSDEAFENAWLARPGAGFQVYPFSASALQAAGNPLARILGPLRLYGEYNRTDYWGPGNSWRPRQQIRSGSEYWRALHVNDVRSFWWTEIWSGLWWQSANEFDSHYNGLIFANAFRTGIRASRFRHLSIVSAYVAVQSSVTDHPEYYWENKLATGGGVRIAPALSSFEGEHLWLNRFVIYGEYLYVPAYYRTQAPSSVPNHELTAGISFSFGDWYR